MAPRFKIPAHVASFTMWVSGGTIIALGASRLFGKDEAQKEEELRSRYSHRVKQSQSQRKDMQEFFDKMKTSQQQQNVKGHDDVFTDVLKSGKGEKRRYSRNREAVEAEYKKSLQEKDDDSKSKV